MTPTAKPDGPVAKWARWMAGIARREGRQDSTDYYEQRATEQDPALERLLGLRSLESKYRQMRHDALANDTAAQATQVEQQIAAVPAFKYPDGFDRVTALAKVRTRFPDLPDDAPDAWLAGALTTILASEEWKESLSSATNRADAADPAGIDDTPTDTDRLHAARKLEQACRLDSAASEGDRERQIEAEAKQIAWQRGYRKIRENDQRQRAARNDSATPRIDAAELEAKRRAWRDQWKESLPNAAVGDKARARTDAAWTSTVSKSEPR